MNNYWNRETMIGGVTKEIRSTANSLVYAFSDPEILSFRERVKWLVELKIKIINSNRCRYCNLSNTKCRCANRCSTCKTNHHSSFNCRRHIMNSKLIKLIFDSDNIKIQLNR